MKNLITIIAISLCVLLGLHILSDQTPSETTNNIIIVGTNAEYPPYAYIENSQIIGFDIDIAQEICQRLGKKMVLEDMPFDALIPSLDLKKVDFVAAGLTCTNERAKRILFSKPYVSGDSLVIISHKDQKLESIKELSGKEILVNEGYTADVYLSQIENLKLIRLSAPADAFIALASKRAHAFVTARSTVQGFLSNNQVNQYHIAPIENTSDGCSIALNKDSSDFLDSIQGTLDLMERDGTILELKKKWNL